MTPVLLWSRPCDADRVAVADVGVVANGARLRILDPRTGSVTREIAGDLAVRGFAVDRDAIVFATDDALFRVGADGVAAWSTPIGVVAVGGGGALMLFDAATGEDASRRANASNLRVAADPAGADLDGNGIPEWVIAADGLYATRGGLEVRWTHDGPADHRAAPLIASVDGRPTVIAAAGPYLTLAHPLSGEISLLWTDPAAGDRERPDPLSRAAVGWCADQGCVVVSAADHATCVAPDGIERWTVPLDRPTAGVCADVDGQPGDEVVLGSASALVAVDAQGRIAWRWPSAATGSPVLADLDGDGHTDVVLPTDRGVIALSTPGAAPSSPRHARGDAGNSGYVR